MISILIVEDSQYKLDTVKKLLTDDLMIDESFITIAMNIKVAKRYLSSINYDLLILDLVLPLEHGDSPTPEKGAGFLRDISSNPNLKPPSHIIGLTEYSEFQSEFDSDFTTNLWHLINYNATQINWQDKLKNLTKYLLNIRARFIDQTQKNYKVDIAIVSALNRPEFDKILDLSPNWNKVTFDNDSTIYYQTEFSKNGKSAKIVAACIDQMGITATANMATKIILKFEPKYIIMSGICAGLKDRDLNFGDILIADQSWDYGSGKMREKSRDKVIQDIEFEPDPRPILLSPDIRAKMSSFLRRTDILSNIQSSSRYNKPKFVLQAKMGPIASGSYVIASESILLDIKNRHRKLLGVEMEAYGLYFSAENTLNQYTKAVMIKSVSDYGDNSKNDDYQDYAAYTSAQFIYYFICEELL